MLGDPARYQRFRSMCPGVSPDESPTAWKKEKALGYRWSIKKPSNQPDIT
jgi:hypothetical protein